METKSKNYARLFAFQKYLAIFLIIIGIPTLLLDKNSGAGTPLLTGLFFLFTSPGMKQDEREISLKTSSLYLSFILAYAIKIISASLYSHRLLPMEMVSINHFMILVFALALIIYYIRFYFFN